MSLERNIEISTDTFARIWAARQDGEETEDNILNRILKTLGTSDQTQTDEDGKNLTEKKGHDLVRRIKADVPSKSTSIVNARYGLEFMEGFKIFRTYKNRTYEAIIENGHWVLLQSGKSFKGLNQLGHSIGIKCENVWINWYYHDRNNLPQRLSMLRSSDRFKTTTEMES